MLAMLLNGSRLQRYQHIGRLVDVKVDGHLGGGLLASGGGSHVDAASGFHISARAASAVCVGGQQDTRASGGGANQ